MITVIIKHDGEDNVIKLTYENLWRELKDIDGAQIIVSPSWFSALDQVKNKFVCFMESDCLVSSGFFTSQLGLLQKNSQNRRIAVMASSTSVEIWVNRFFGYDIASDYVEGFLPNKDKKSSVPYMVEVAYIPGALIRLATLKNLIKDKPKASEWEKDLVQLSVNLSLNFWSRGIGNGIGTMVYINPNATYVTTEKYVNDITKFTPDVDDVSTLLKMFRQQTI